MNDLLNVSSRYRGEGEEQGKNKGIEEEDKNEGEEDFFCVFACFESTNMHTISSYSLHTTTIDPLRYQ